MKIFLNLILISSYILINSCQLSAQENTRSSYSKFVFSLENDVFMITDKYYSQGTNFTWIRNPFITDQSTSVRSKLTRSLFSISTFFGQEQQQRNISFGFKQLVYTPRDIKSTELVTDDNPYAGAFLFPIGFHTISNHSISSLIINVGILGPHSFTKQFQKGFHKIIGDINPKGWDNQLGDEPIINLNFKNILKGGRKDISRQFGLEILPHYGFGVGNLLTNLNAGFQTRIGWNLPNNFGSYNILPELENSSKNRRSADIYTQTFKYAVNFFAGLNSELIIRDIFLDGNTFSDSHSVTKKRFRLLASIGTNVKLSKFVIDFAYFFQSKAFDIQKSGHKYGGVVISYLF